MRRALLTLVCLTAVGPALGQVPAGGMPSQAPAPAKVKPSAIDFEQKLNARVSLDLPLRDEGDHRVALRDAMVPGKPVVLVLAYYRCPMLCNKVLVGLLDVMRQTPYTAGVDYTVVVVSFDHKEHGREATEIKKTYVGHYGRPEGGRGWRFLTAGIDSVNQLTDTVGFKFEYDKTFKEFNHPAGIVFLTPDGRISRYMYGIQFSDPPDPAEAATTPEAARTAKTFRLALVEAGEGKIGSFADKLILSCYRFDHLSQGYSFNVMVAVRVGGVVTVLALIGAVVYFRRRERRAGLQGTPAAVAVAAGPTEGGS